MNKQKLKLLKWNIASGKFPKKHPHFGGADLIITDDPNRNFHKGDILVLTEHASAFSWLIFKLKEIYAEELDYSNKYFFYPRLGELMLEASGSKMDIFEQMEYIVDSIQKEFIVMPKNSDASIEDDLA